MRKTLEQDLLETIVAVILAAIIVYGGLFWLALETDFHITYEHGFYQNTEYHVICVSALQSEPQCFQFTDGE